MRCEPCSGLLWRSDQTPASQAGGTLATLQSTQRTVTEVPVRAGCTSGHGVCGISRLSPRAVVATAMFMAFGFATVYVVRHLIVT